MEMIELLKRIILNLCLKIILSTCTYFSPHVNNFLVRIYLCQVYQDLRRLNKTIVGSWKTGMFCIWINAVISGFLKRTQKQEKLKTFSWILKR